jgi:hypothetical protein
MNTGAFTLSGLTANGWGSYRVTVTAPESGSLVLLLVGLLVLFGGRRLRWLA